jgi:hypothetical protein
MRAGEIGSYGSFDLNSKPKVVKNPRKSDSAASGSAVSEEIFFDRMDRIYRIYALF